MEYHDHEPVLSIGKVFLGIVEPALSCKPATVVRKVEFEGVLSISGAMIASWSWYPPGRRLGATGGQWQRCAIIIAVP